LDDAQINTRRCKTGTPAMKTGRWNLQFRHPSAASAAAEFQDLVTQWRRAPPSPGSIRGCVLKGENSIGEFYSVGGGQQLPASGHRHEDDSHRPQYPQHDRPRREYRQAMRRNNLPGSREDFAERRGRAQFHAMRLVVDGPNARRNTFPYMEVKNAPPPSSTKRVPRK